MNWRQLSYQTYRNQRYRWRYRYGSALIIVLLSLFSVLGVWATAESSADSGAGEVYGPENLLKTWRTPFTTALPAEEEVASSSSDTLSLIAISSRTRPELKNLLAERFHGPKLYLPNRMVLGQSEEFTIKGNPGSYAAVAMSEKDKGAKPIYGHNVRLGFDRKLVAVGQIPEQGILSVFVETPIQGDLVGSPLYFEAAVWSKPDFSDMQIASAVSTTEDSSIENGVIVCEQEGRKERAVVFDVGRPMSMKSVGSLSSGKP